MTAARNLPIRPNVAIVVPVFNRLQHTRTFLRQCQQLTYPDVEIIIVDDGSTDGTAEMVRQEFPSVHLIRQAQGNLWWSKATNVGVRIALERGADFVLTINDDVTFDPSFLERLVAYAVQHPRTLVGSMIYAAEDPARVWYAGGKFAWWLGDMLHRRSLDDGSLDWLTGMGTLIPAEAFAEAGWYDDEHFPQYGGDSDFSIRARAKGFALAIEPGAKIWNQTDASTETAMRRAATWGTFFSPLFSRKSNSQLAWRLHFYRRHCPLALRPVAVVAYYLRFTGKQLLRVLKLR